MSRAGDPNTDTHLLVQNAAQGPDARWTALDSDRLYAHLMAADHLYLAAERAALTQRLGVRWGRVEERSGAAEIQGLDDRTVIERFSKRSEQIDQWLDSHGLSGIKASSAAAVATRAPKDYSESGQSVYQRWTAELAEQGVDERQLAEVCSGGRGRPGTRTEVDAVLDALAGPDGLTGQVSTFARTDVVDALAKRLPVVARSVQEAITQVEATADRFLAERAVRVAYDRRLGVERFSTPELMALERQLVDGAIRRAEQGCAVVRPEVVRQVLDRHASAGVDQAATVADLTRGGTGVALTIIASIGCIPPAAADPATGSSSHRARRADTGCGRASAGLRNLGERRTATEGPDSIEVGPQGRWSLKLSHRSWPNTCVVSLKLAHSLHNSRWVPH